MPDLAERVEHYAGERPVFDLYGVEDEIQRAMLKEVPLKSGGHLIVDQTEAMTTIDVNTGSFLGQRNLEETVYRTNLEAAQSVARQLRLRNLGGIIIIDFIDMTDDEHKRQVLRTLEKGLARDHARTAVYDFSPLGLVEMTRKRTTESLERQLCEPCHECGGRGSLKTCETIAYEIFREITRAVRQFEASQLLVIASPRWSTRSPTRNRPRWPSWRIPRQGHPLPGRRPVRAGTIRRGAAVANVTTPLRRRIRHARRCLGYGSLVVLIALALVVSVFNQLLAAVESHPEQIARWLSERVGEPVSFSRARGEWTRRGPRFVLDDLHVGQGAKRLAIGRAQLQVAAFTAGCPGIRSPS
jgi:hypothetical protein